MSDRTERGPSQLRRTAAAVVLAAVMGCSSDPPLGPVCGAELGQAVAVYLRDARTRAALATASARGTVQEGAFVDSAPVAGKIRRFLPLPCSRFVQDWEGGFPPRWENLHLQVLRFAQDDNREVPSLPLFSHILFPM
jgi:hypothetical protein